VVVDAFGVVVGAAFAGALETHDRVTPETHGCQSGSPSYDCAPSNPGSLSFVTPPPEASIT
jgi:hypothetical protein